MSFAANFMPTERGPAAWTLQEAEAIINDWLQAGRKEDARHALAMLSARFSDNEPITQLKQKLDYEAHVAKVRASLSGPDYRTWLALLHNWLEPKTYMEIGVASGCSLTLAKPPTYCIGVDPKPMLSYPIRAWARVFAETSDNFFARRDVPALFGGKRIDFAFIDGLHNFDQALRDFANVERNAHGGTVAVLHDTLPVIAETATRARTTVFWLGDTWKAIPILRKLRPDLNLFTIPCYPSGLTVVSGLSPDSSVLEDRLSEEVAAWMPVQWQDCVDAANETLGVVPSEEGSVRTRLGR